MKRFFRVTSCICFILFLGACVECDPVSFSGNEALLKFVNANTNTTNGLPTLNIQVESIRSTNGREVVFNPTAGGYFLPLNPEDTVSNFVIEVAGNEGIDSIPLVYTQRLQVQGPDCTAFEQIEALRFSFLNNDGQKVQTAVIDYDNNSALDSSVIEMGGLVNDIVNPNIAVYVTTSTLKGNKRLNIGFFDRQTGAPIDQTFQSIFATNAKKELSKNGNAEVFWDVSTTFFGETITFTRDGVEQVINLSYAPNTLMQIPVDELGETANITDGVSKIRYLNIVPDGLDEDGDPIFVFEPEIEAELNGPFFNKIVVIEDRLLNDATEVEIQLFVN